MAKIISITSGKGGAGKSSISTGLACAFSKRGKRVLILELDIGLRCVDIMLGVENRVVYDLGDIIAGRCSISDAVILSDTFPNLHYIAAPVNIAGDFHFDKILRCIRYLKKNYEIILIDTPAGLGISILSVQNLSDLAVIVTTPDPICIRDGEKVASLIEEVGFSDYKLIINRVNRVNMRKSSVNDLDAVIDGVGAQLLGVVAENDEYQLALSSGQWVSEKNILVKVFDAISRRIEGEYIPLVIDKL